MFKVLDLPAEGAPQESLDNSAVSPPQSGRLRWVDLIETDGPSLELLQQRFGFHPLAIEDCASFELRSKVDEYDDHLFVVLHTFTAAEDDPIDIQIHEVHAFLGPDYLVTVHDNRVPAAEHVWKRVGEGAARGRKSGWLLYMNADAMVDSIFPMLESVTRKLDQLEDQLLDGDFEGEDEQIRQLFRIKRTLVNMRRVVRGVRDVVGILGRRTKTPMSKRTALYFRDVQDHAVRCAETIEEALVLAANVLSSYQTAVSNRTNEIVRKLTLFSVIFLPLGFITGFWGQNFAHLPIDSGTMFAGMLVATVAVPVVLMVWFWRRGWL